MNIIGAHYLELELFRQCCDAYDGEWRTIFVAMGTQPKASIGTESGYFHFKSFHRA